MRLYNPDSCTPMGVTSVVGPKWTPPAAFVPTDSKYATDNSPTRHSSSPESTNGRDFKRDSVDTFSNNTNVNKLPKGGTNIDSSVDNCFHFDIETLDTMNAPVREADYQDDLSRNSSSTLSTHTTLIGFSLSNQESAHRVIKYGISMPFPHPTGTNFKTPSKKPSGKIHQVSEARYAHETKTEGTETNESPFKVVKRDRTNVKPKTSAYSSGLETEHPGPKRNQQPGKPSSTKCSRARTTGQTSNCHPCPQLTMTDSSEESNWFDFSSDVSQNPFMDSGSRGNEKDIHFSPIEKAPPNPNGAPIMTVKPSLKTGTVFYLFPRHQTSTKVQELHKPLNSQNPQQEDRGSRKQVDLIMGKPRAGGFHPVGSTMRSPSSQNSVSIEGQQRGVPFKLPPSPRDIEQFVQAPLHPVHAEENRSVRRNPADVSKYAIMLKSGFSSSCVQRTMERDQVDPSIIDLVSLLSKGARD